jgi:chromosomal replication initiator protein
MSPYIIPGLKKSIRVVSDTEEKHQIIIDAVLKYRDQLMVQICTRKRTADLVYSRQLCVYLLRNFTTLSWSAIGALFGTFDHTTAIHSYKRIKDLMDVDDLVRTDIANLKRIIL